MMIATPAFDEALARIRERKAAEVEPTPAPTPPVLPLTPPEPLPIDPPKVLPVLSPPPATPEKPPGKERGDPHTAYLPSHEQIRRECLRIQRTWSPEERRRRARGLILETLRGVIAIQTPKLTVPTCRLAVSGLDR